MMELILDPRDMEPLLIEEEIHLWENMIEVENLLAEIDGGADTQTMEVQHD